MALTGGATAEAEPPRRTRLRRELTWGVVTQGSSSAANLLLSIFAGRALGPAGLGVVFIGFAALQVVQALGRSVLVQPLIAYAAARPDAERDRLAGIGVTVAALIGLGASVVFAAVALAVRDESLRESFLIFLPWLALPVLHELWKAVLFQEGKAAPAAASEAARLAVMVLATPLALQSSASELVAIWGIASLVGLAVAVLAYRVPPRRPQSAIVAWRDAGWELGRWLGAREIVFHGSAYGTTMLLAFVIGTAGVGGLRSADVLFSPFSLIAGALIFPALPVFVRAVEHAPESARRLALLLSTLASALGLAYFVVVALTRSWLLPFVFGKEFERYESLVWPMGAAQLFHAAGFGFVVWLTASRRGRAAFVTGLIWGITSLVAATALGAEFGTSGAAWGMTIAAALSALSATVLALGLDRRAGVASPARRDP